MQKLTFFHLEECPYCAMAFEALDELKKANPEYENIEIDFVEEESNPDIAAEYDYSYDPCIFIGKRKVYECRPFSSKKEIADGVRKALEEGLK